MSIANFIKTNLPAPITNTARAEASSLKTLADLQRLITVAKRQGAGKDAKFKVNFDRFDLSTLEISWPAND